MLRSAPPAGPRRSIAAALIAVLALGLIAGACAQSPEAKKQKAVERGEQYLKDGKLNEAVIELRNALQIDADYLPAVTALGRAYSRKGWHGDAARELLRAHKVAPGDTQVALEAARELLEIGAVRDAEELAGKVLAAKPNQREALLVRASALLPQGRIEEATAAIDAATPGPPSLELQHLRALALLAQRKPVEAERAYRDALAVDPKDPRSLSGLAALKLGQGETKEALRLFEEARPLLPNDPRVRIGLAESHVRLGEIDKAIRELESLEPRARTAGVVVALSRCYLIAGRSSEAAALLVPVAERIKTPEVRYLLGVAYLGTNNPGRAVEQFEEVSRRLPDAPLVQLRLAQAYLQRGQAKEALSRLDAVAKPLDKVPAYHLERARTLLALGRTAEATQTATAAQKLRPEGPEPYMLLGLIRAREGDAKGAQQLFSKAAEADATYAPARVALGQLDVGRNDLDAALQDFDAAVKANPKSLTAARAKAAVLARQGKTREAIDFVSGLAKNDPRNAGLQSLLGNILLSDRQFDAAGTAYRKALELDARGVEPRLGLARLALAQNKDDEALNQLQAAIKQHPDQPAAVLLLAMVADRRGRYDLSIPVLEAATKDTGTQGGVSVVLAQHYLKAGRYDDAIKLTTDLIARDSAANGARLTRAQASLAKRDAAAALRDAQDAAKGNPKSGTAQILIARAYALQGKSAEAQAAYREALRVEPGLQSAETELAAVSGKPMEATAQAKQVDDLRAAIQRDPRNAALRETLARTLLVAGKTADAQAELKALLDVVPGHVTGNLMMASILQASGKPDDAATYLRAALRSNSSQLEANVAMARYLQSKGRREEAATHLQNALRVNPDLADVKLMLATTYAGMGRRPEALRLVQEVEKAAPTSPEPLVLKGSLLLGQREPRPAVEAFNAALKLKPDSVPALRGLGMAYDQLKEPARAIEQYRKALAIAPKDAITLNNLAWLLSEDPRKLDEALPLAARAVEVAPDVPSMIDTLGWIHYRRGSYPEAEKALVRAADREPRNALMQYHLGMTYYRLGKKNEAASALKRAAQLDPELAAREKVQDVLKELGG